MPRGPAAFPGQDVEHGAGSVPQQLSLFGDDPAPAAPPPPRATPPAPVSAAPAPPSEMPSAERPLASEFHHPRGQREMRLAGHRVVYELKRARRRTIGFVVGPDGLAVSAPRWLGQGEIESALAEKAGWILRKLHEQRERAARVQAARVEWREGGSVPFLGEPVILVLDPRVAGAVLHSDAEALPGVPKLALHLGLPQTAEPAQVRDLVQSWLQRQARRIFEERCALFAERLGVRMTRLALSSASTRWGSASADGSIRLNWRLVHFAMPIVDYVVTHELAHLREMNHGPAFWDVVRQALPGFEAARGALRHEVLPELDP